MHEASLTLGSWGNRRLSADLGAEIEPCLAVRVNAMTEDSDSYRRGVNVKSSGFNPSFTSRAGSNANIALG